MQHMQHMPRRPIPSRSQCISLLRFLLLFVGLLAGVKLAVIAVWRWGGEAPRRRVAQTNKYWINPIATHVFKAGGRYSPYAVIRHVGRRSGRTYCTPVIACRVDDQFVVPLPYGRRTDWHRNLQAAGDGTLVWQGAVYALGAPKPMPATTALPAFPRLWQAALRVYGVGEYVSLPLALPDQEAGARRRSRSGEERLEVGTCAPNPFPLLRPARSRLWFPRTDAVRSPDRSARDGARERPQRLPWKAPVRHRS